MTKKKTQEKAHAVLTLLVKRYPEPDTHLVAKTPWELLIATVLSAQCTDERVNKVTPHLFAKWPDANSLAKAPLAEVEKAIYSTGFYRNKAKNIIAASMRIVAEHNGQVPQTMQELIMLAGVARKTANVVLWSAYGINEGIAVDTHVKRIALRLGLAKGPSVEAIEKELMAIFPQKEWGMANHRLVWFGRHVCIAQSPQCSVCELATLCDKKGVEKFV